MFVVMPRGQSRSTPDQATTSAAPSTSTAEAEDPQEEAEEDAETIQVDTSIVSTDESTAFFVGSLIRRLDCGTCAVALGEKKKKGESSGFISEMTYERSELYVPKSELLNIISALVKPVSNFLNSNLTKRQLVHISYERFNQNFDSLSWCSVAHKKTFFTFFSRTLIRILCKVRNATLKEKKSKKVYQKKLKKLNVL